VGIEGAGMLREANFGYGLAIAAEFDDGSLGTGILRERLFVCDWLGESWGVCDGIVQGLVPPGRIWKRKEGWDGGRESGR
jgi:hypothetical protein